MSELSISNHPFRVCRSDGTVVASYSNLLCAARTLVLMQDHEGFVTDDSSLEAPATSWYECKALVDSIRYEKYSESARSGYAY